MLPSLTRLIGCYEWYTNRYTWESRIMIIFFYDCASLYFISCSCRLQSRRHYKEGWQDRMTLWLWHDSDVCWVWVLSRSLMSDRWSVISGLWLVYQNFKRYQQRLRVVLFIFGISNDKNRLENKYWHAPSYVNVIIIDHNHLHYAFYRLERWAHFFNI